MAKNFSGMTNIFERNCDLWGRRNPQQAILLHYLPDRGPEGTLSAESPQEAAEWFQRLDLANIDIIFVYGIGLGFYFAPIHPWLEQDASRVVVFLEDDLSAIRRFLETPEAATMLEDPQFRLYYFHEVTGKEGLIERMFWSFASKRFIVTGLNSYVHSKSTVYEQLRHGLTFEFSLKNALLDEYLHYGASFYANFYQNIIELPHASLGTLTFGTFKKVPAVICGAGPSLEKSLPLLASLIDKALVFAGGSAMNVLNAAGLQPHFGAGIDPNAAQVERINANYAYEVPFFYTNRMHHDALSGIHGPRLYVTGCGGYHVSDYFEERLGIATSPLDEGRNVVNFCLQIASKLGCDPIIFIGMDLGFTDLKAYAQGVEEENLIDPERYERENGGSETLVLRQDIYGRPLYTLWKWIAEAEWIGRFAREHPEHVIINATEGGLGFPAVSDMPLQMVSSMYLTRSFPLRERVHAEVQRASKQHVSARRVLGLTKKLYKSLLACIEHIEVLCCEVASFVDGEEAVYKQGWLAALAETEMVEEPAYKYILDIFDRVMLCLHHPLLQDIGLLPTGRVKELKKEQLHLQRLSFLKEAAQVNAHLLEMCLQRFSTKSRTVGKHLVVGQRLPHQIADEIRSEINELVDGECRLYDERGQLKAVCIYKHNVLHGPSLCYAEDGQILVKSNYENGKQTGEAKWFYLSGALYAIQHYKDGVWHGRQYYYYEDGTPKSILSYKTGVLHGQVKLFSPDGSLKRSCCFHQGLLTKVCC